jgi:hypothetical protein
MPLDVHHTYTGCVSPQYHCRFNNFFETVRHGEPDVSVLTAWQQLSGLTVMSQTPSMEYHDVPRPSELIQFENNAIAPTQESLLVTPLTHLSSSSTSI